MLLVSFCCHHFAQESQCNINEYKKIYCNYKTTFVRQITGTGLMFTFSFYIKTQMSRYEYV